MSIRNSLGTLGDILKTYHILEEKLKNIDKDIKDLTAEFKEARKEHVSLRTEHANLAAKVVGLEARLEAGRETIKAEVRKELADEVHKHQIEFMRLQMELKGAFHEAQAEMRRAALALPSPQPQEIKKAEDES